MIQPIKLKLNRYQWPLRPWNNETWGVHILMNKVNFGIYASKKTINIWCVHLRGVFGVYYMDENWPCSHLLCNVNVSITVNKESTVNNFSPIKSWLFERKNGFWIVWSCRKCLSQLQILCSREREKNLPLYRLMFYG